MKPLRAWGLAVGGLAVLLLAGGTMLHSPRFQTWATRRWLAAHPGLHGTIGAVKAGFSSVTLQDARFESDGAVLTLPSVEVELPVIATVFHRASVHRLVAKNWTLDLSHARNVSATLERVAGLLPRRPVASTSHGFSLLPSAYAAEPGLAPAFRGIIGRCVLPFDLALGRVELEGEIVLPKIAGHGPVHLTTELHGGGLAEKEEGNFALDLAGARGDGSSITLHTTVAAAMDTPRTFTRLATRSELVVSGVQIPEGVRLTVDATVARVAAGESYALAWTSGPKRLAALQAELATGTGQVSGTWEIDTKSADVEAFAFGRQLPDFAATGGGQFETDGSLREVHAQGRLAASVEHLDRARAELSAIGAVKLAAEFDVLHHGDSLRVDKFSAEASNETPILRVNALQAFEFNLRTAELRVADPKQDLFGVALAGVPVAWVRPFLGAVQVSGGDVRGELVAGARDGGLEVRTKSPLTVSTLSLSRQGQPCLRDVDIALSALADYTPQGWQAQVADLSARHEGVTLLALHGKAGQLASGDRAIKLTGQWQSDLAGWPSQPVVDRRLALADGEARGNFTGSLDRTRELELNLAISRLRATSGEKLPDMSVNARVDLAADGKATFKLPMLFDRAGKKSDLLLAGTVSPASPATIDCRATGDSVEADDLKLLLLLFPATGTAAAPPGDSSKPATDGPIWGADRGQIGLALKKVAWGDRIDLGGVGGTLRFTPTGLKAEGIRAVLGVDAGVTLDGEVKFDAKAEHPYALAADLAVNNYDLAASFRAIDPTRPPSIEGRVSASQHLVGQGATPMEAFDRATGDLQLTSRGGLCRLLAVDLADKVQKTGSTAAVVGELLGTVTRKKGYADYTNKAQILNDLAKELAEIPFDQLSATVTLSPDREIVLKDCALISPEIRLAGRGRIKFVVDTPVAAEPLELDLTLGARGKLADLIKRARLLQDKQDDLGYSAFGTPFKIGGTLAKPDASDLGKAILNSGLETNGLIDRMLGK